MSSGSRRGGEQAPYVGARAPEVDGVAAGRSRRGAGTARLPGRRAALDARARQRADADHRSPGWPAMVSDGDRDACSVVVSRMSLEHAVQPVRRLGVDRPSTTSSVLRDRRAHGAAAPSVLSPGAGSSARAHRGRHAGSASVPAQPLGVDPRGFGGCGRRDGAPAASCRCPAGRHADPPRRFQGVLEPGLDPLAPHHRCQHVRRVARAASRGPRLTRDIT